jgi:hypothetical protein
MSVPSKTGGQARAYGRHMAHIDAAALDAAERFVLRDARLLDRHRFAHQFRGGPGAAVVAALRPYANLDGGFGNALEPDLRGAASQPEPVEVAFRLLDETDGGAAFAGPLVDAACVWLGANSAADGGVPWVLPSVVDAPRAPWWQPVEGSPGALVPTASIAGLLHAHGHEHPWLDGATRFCRERIDAIAAEGAELDPYTAVAVLDFLDHVPDRDWAEKAFAGVGDAVLATVTFDPDAPGHVHLPIEFAPRPDGFGPRLFDAGVLDRHLDLLVDGQADDGGWGIGWEAWAPVTVPEWRGHVTVERLKLLRAHGRWRV